MKPTLLEVLPQTPSSPHESAHLHAAGTGQFIDDRPPTPRELMVGLVFSPHAKARISRVDLAKAQRMIGVQCFTAQDLSHNRWGAIFHEQPLLAEHEVNYVGEIVAIIAAPTMEQVREAIKAVVVEYLVEPAILSIEQAIEHKSFIGEERQISRGDAVKELQSCTHQLAGILHFKGADHFYLENQTALAYPTDQGGIEIHSSTQHPTEVQSMVAQCLGLPIAQVTCIAERLGGGFGGKETQAAPFAVYAALVAQKTRRPARLVLSKDEDMLMTGKRNPYQVHYEVGFDAEGLIKALDVYFYGDGGAYADLSTSILERAMAHVDNAYYLPAARIRGIVCRTNFHSHTAFRGFGGPKGVGTIEHILEEIGHTLGVDALTIRQRNCYQGERNVTPYHQKVENNLLPELFHTLAERSEYWGRRKSLDDYHKDPTKNPRGLALTAIKFGISFTTRFLNQGHALVHLFRDGSVAVATGAVEMGQGVQVRIKGLVAEALGINENQVRILPTATDKSANTSPTAASSGTDLNGTAAVMAVQQIKERLAGLFWHLIDLPTSRWPQKTAGLATEPEVELGATNPDTIFANQKISSKLDPSRTLDLIDVIEAAYLSRLALSAYGFYKVPHLDFDKVKGAGQAFLYFTQGVACSEVEIDRITGELKILRSDILMDLGRPINAAMDRGQIAGAFVQGVGWVTSENLFYNEQGRLLSHAPSTYKIPSIHDMPRIFNIDLIKNEGNTVNIRGTKAAGEPPLMLCFSVWNAMKNALAYARRTPGPLPCLPIPATAEATLRKLCPRDFRQP
jgi:xanthine dehydrogenase large subunit